MKYYDRYQRGEYREVYQELQQLGAHVFHDSMVQEASSVAHAMMQRVRYNLQEVLLPRLHRLGYQFGAGCLEHADVLTEEEYAQHQQEFHLFEVARPEAVAHIEDLQQLVGAIPLTLEQWYHQIHTMNLIGAFPASVSPIVDGYPLKRGYDLNSLAVYPLDMTLQFLKMEHENWHWEQEQGISWEEAAQEEQNMETPAISLSWDQPAKYGYRGGFDYALVAPFTVFDGTLDLSGTSMSFVDYVRWCIQWAGSPGLEMLWQTPRCPLTQDELDFLTRDLLPF